VALQGGKIGKLKIAPAERGWEGDREDRGGAEFGVDGLLGKVERWGDHYKPGILAGETVREGQEMGLSRPHIREERIVINMAWLIRFWPVQ
jgi:hypothetical protein